MGVGPVYASPIFGVNVDVGGSFDVAAWAVVHLQPFSICVQVIFECLVIRMVNREDPVVAVGAGVGDDLVGGSLSTADALDFGTQVGPSGCGDGVGGGVVWVANKFQAFARIVFRLVKCAWAVIGRNGCLESFSHILTDAGVLLSRDVFREVGGALRIWCCNLVGADLGA